MLPWCIALERRRQRMMAIVEAARGTPRVDSIA
jgi:hypothetical protein